MPIPEQVVAVLFDAVGTLIEPHPPVAAVYEAAARAHGSRLTSDTIRNRFRAAFATTETATNEAHEQARWRSIVAAVIDDVPAERFEPLFAQLWQHFARPTSWRLFSDVAPAWTTIVERGYRAGIASNFDARLRTVAAGLPPLDSCERFFISSEIGFAKPDPRFFTAVERQLQLLPEQILLIGDDETNDHQGAQAAGWQSLWLRRVGGTSRPDEINNLARVLEP